jgi:hypothetical protein
MSLSLINTSNDVEMKVVDGIEPDLSEFCSMNAPLYLTQSLLTCPYFLPIFD